jgi:Helix-turn-helix domain
MNESDLAGGVPSGRSGGQDAAQALGALIRDLRSAVGWSQGRLAVELNHVAGHATVNRECVSRWENGRRCPGPFWLRHLATALDVPLMALEEANGNMRRRVFLTDVAAAAIAPVAAADLIANGFAAALRTRPSAETWQGKLETYGRDYMIMGAGEIRRRLAGDLVLLQQQVDSPAMWGVAARLMVIFGKTFPGGDGARATSWYRMASTASDRSDDAATRVWVRGRTAIALAYEGASLPVADRAATQALAIEDRPSLGRLNAIMGQAHAAALRGDRCKAVELLTQGRHMFDVAGSADDEVSDYSVPWWRQQVFVSLLAARLGDERVALQAQDAAAASLPASLPRFRTHLELHRALMLARAGDRKGGVAYARKALDRLPPEKHSLTLRMLLAEVKAAGRR